MSDTRLNSLVESSAESLETLRQLTAADIAASKTLQGLGASAGDAVDTNTNELVRNVSSQPQGQVLTQSDISNSLTLQKLGAKAGDQIVGDELVKSEDDSSIESLVRDFEYGFKSNGNLFTNLADYLESKVPLGRLTFGGDSLVSIERMPEDIRAMDSDARLAYIAEQRRQALDEEFGDYVPTSGAAATAGAVTKAIADPINLLYAGRTVAGATGIGAGYGFVDSTLEQVTSGEEFDLGEAAKDSAITGLFAGAITKGVKAIQERPAALTKKQKVLQEAINMRIATGVAPAKALQEVAKEFNVSDAQMAKMAAASGEKIRVGKSGLGPTAEADFDSRIVHDSAVSKVESSVIKDTILAINNRLDAIHPMLGGRMRRHESKLHVETQDALAATNKWRAGVAALPKGVRTEFTQRLNNGQFDAAKKILERQAPELIKEWPKISKMFDTNFRRLKAAGHKNLTKVDNYFPRVIKDREGLINALGTKGRTSIEKLMEAAAKQANKQVKDLDEIEQSEVFDLYFRGYRANKGVDGYTLASTLDRNLKVIPSNLMKYYHTADKALELNIRSTINDINRREFFGRNLKTDKAGGVDAAGSIGDMLAEINKRGEIDDKGMQYARKLFDARFIGGEATGNKLQKKIREYGFIGTIANPLSALTQITDLAVSFHKNGIGSTVGALARAVAGKSKVKQAQAGVDAGNKELQEVMEGDSALSYVLERSFALSGFKVMDRIMKETTINAAHSSLKKQVKTAAGRKKLGKQYAPIFREEWPQVVKDLQDGTDSMAVRELLFSKLAEVQPISRSELPAVYNANPNYRWMFMLKSFMLKQLDIAKRDVFDQIRSGNPRQIAEGFKNAVVLGSLYGSMGAGVAGAKDWLKGKEPFEEGLMNEAVWSVGGVYSVNEYLVRDLKAGNFGNAAASFVVPPLALFENGYKTLEGVVTEDEEKTIKGLSRMPVIGPVIGFFMSDNNPF